ncbi:hypothetical protein Y032_0222g2625 [Ancylostoma ceylanicum]|uniref:SCP domain-containing protein n=1 Tax=Ancylostoma ceylanicum TaxID=53326 RepID=A0A016SHZ8_9BILA|nr:hypothetical protein Y032_0222g2625 [Ancylostoma ceylanicum]
MALFAILLVTVVYSVLPNNAVELVIDHPEKCILHRPFRTILNKFHNELRQDVAKGEAEVERKSLGPAREMYGLVYDCALEEEASHEMTLPGFAALFNRGMISFSGEYKGSANTALEKLLPTLYGNETSLRQLVYPKAARFGCWGKLKKGSSAGNRKMEFVCLYDKKPQDGESLEGGNFCNEDKDCTFYKRSYCENNLCYVQ